MNAGFINEYEVMHNVALGAEALLAFTSSFETGIAPGKQQVTLWHCATVLPLCLHEPSRRAILKRRHRSGLRSILTRDPENDIAQNEPIFSLNSRIYDLFPRTVRSLNCAFGWGLLTLDDGAVLARAVRRRPPLEEEAADVVRAAGKLGAWAGGMTAFEYLTVLGIRFRV